MKKLILILLIAVFFAGCTAEEEPFKPGEIRTYGDFGYSILNDGTVIIRKYTGADAEVIIPAVIDSISVTVIGRSVFRGNEQLTSVVFPDSITHIEPEAFRECTSLTGVVLPDGIKRIGYRAFQKTAIENINLPVGIIEIGGNAFGGTLLTSIEFPAGIKTVGGGAFSGTAITSVVIPDSVESIGDGAFSGMSELTEVIIPNSVTRIGQKAFANCTSLEYILIPNSVTSIGIGKYTMTNPQLTGAFLGCTGLKNAVYKGKSYSITFIGNYTVSSGTDIRSSTAVHDLPAEFYAAVNGD
jgi:hypothetical protein